MTNAEQIVVRLLEDDEKPGNKLPDWLAKKLGRKKEGEEGESSKGEGGEESAGSAAADSPRKSGGSGSSFASSEGTVKKTW